MAVEVERLIVALEARLDGYNRGLTQAQALTNQKLGAIERRFDHTTRNMRSSAVSMGAVLGSLGAYLSVGALRAYADSWNSITRALEASEQIFGIRLRSAEELNKLANEGRINNDALSKLYIRTAAATRELGVSEEDVAKAATTVAKALKLGSASASEQTSTMLQLSQALQKGKLDGDEFRTVMENAGVIQELLADKLKVSKGEIVKMAAEGKLKVNDLFGALVDGAEKVDRIFGQMPATLEEGFVVLNNQIEQYIGHIDKTYNVTQSLSGALAFLARNIETIGDAALVAGIGLLVMFAPAIIAGVIGLGVAAATAAGTVGLLSGGIGAAVAAFSLFGDDLKVAEDGLVSFKDVVQALAQEFQVTMGVFDEFEQRFAYAGEAFRGEYLEDFATRVRRTARELALARGFVDSTETNRAIPDKPIIKTTDVDKVAERARKNFERDLLRAEQRIDMAKLEGDAIGRSAEQVEYMRTKQELLNEARKAGVDLTAADLIKIEALAVGTARAVTEAENLQRAFQEASEESKQMLSGFIKDMKDGVSASEALGNALNKIADKLIDMAVNDLVEVALGGLTGRGGNPAQGGLAAGLMSLFGFAKGGIAAHGRPQALPRFAGGGVSRSAAIFGEAGPEAAVPLPDGRRIPVDLRMPDIPRANAGGSGAVNVTVAPVFNMQGATEGAVSKAQQDMVPKIKELVRNEVGQIFDRKARFSRSGI